MLPGECVGTNETDCKDCGEHLRVKVCQSSAGYYIGFDCPRCGPYSRESGYFRHKDAADMSLLTDTWRRRADG